MAEPRPDLDALFAGTREAITAAAERARPRLEPREIGIVTHVGGGIAEVRGLPHVGSEELVQFQGGLEGIAINLEPDGVGVVLLGDSQDLAAGTEVRATGRLTDTAVGEALLGRVFDATGRPLDGLGPLRVTERLPVERGAPGVMDRVPVTHPLLTGIKVVDALIPIGRGQRELIVGDRQTGKTAVAVDAILNQRDQGVICVYCAIGQRGTAVARVVETLRAAGALDYTAVIVAAGEDAPGLQFITPYAAMSVCEHFAERGRDVLLVLDDLTRHARAYRELSLLLRRPPGREAYPGDIFYIHSRLLERSAALADTRGGGSVTTLPIVETQAQDISAYIPTNLISITDGQIYLSPDLFSRGVLPAIDVGRSVSRVGGKTQLPAFRAVAGDLRLAYSQFEELEAFARFATRLDEATLATIERGRRVRAVLAQPEQQPLAAGAQVAVLYAITHGLFDHVPVERMDEAERAVVEAARPDLSGRVESGAQIEPHEWDAMRQAAHDALASRPELHA